ncbi:protein NETWORKED 4B-like [Tripterygium wilfordii]|uniref:protein NETWORKED 4B-like n=1 Tax=Tripterygium wilfordii TaxID=458696 RepID=UPI0018F85535|nr:protein NETWORKED 4B-like [Tripterygium wilfordii]
MEINKASSSRCPDSSDRLPASQWLQTTLSGMEKKMKAMMNLLEEDSDSSAQKADIYYRRSTDLKQMLEEFNKSYLALAEEHDQLRSELHQDTNSGSSASNFKSTQDASNDKKRVIGSFDDSKVKGLYSHSQSLDEKSILEYYSATSELENLSKLADQLVSTESCMINSRPQLGHRDDIVGKENTCAADGDTSFKTNDFQFFQAAQEESPLGSYESQNTWSELNHQFTKLMQENLQQQAELARRNIEKKVAIKGLQLEVKCLKRENAALQDCLRYSKVYVNHKKLQRSKLGGKFVGNFFGGGCS